VPDLSGGPGPGPGPTCDNLPSPTCVDTATEKCGDIIAFEPNEGPGYHDYDLNGEGYGQYSHGLGEYRSYARRDLMMLVKWASAYVACKSEGWTGGNGYPIGLGDMSESKGEIPGTAVGSPGHPEGTHVDGYDIDIAYYQNELTGQPNNFLRAICDHQENGADQYHCISEPYMLDLWRSSLFIGALFSSPRTRVIGVDGKVGAMIDQALDVLCADGWVPAAGCQAANQSLGYELQNEGMGWYYHHHHHLHLSLFNIGNSFMNSNPCLTPDCSPMDYSISHLEHGLVHGHVRNEEFLPVSLPRLDPPLW